MCVSFLPNLESVKCLECKAFAQFFPKSFLTSILEKKRRKGVIPFKISQKFKVAAFRNELGFRLQIQKKNARNWLKSESVWNSFYLCFYITLCLWCQFLFRNNNGRELNFTFFASFYESIRKKLSNFLSLQMMYVSRKTESFTFCLKYSLQFSKLILKYFFH